MFRLSSLLRSGRYFLRLCREYPIQLRVLGEAVYKGQDDIPVKQKALAFTGVGDIRELMRGDIELFWVVSRVMRKIVYGSGRNLLQGAA